MFNLIPLPYRILGALVFVLGVFALGYHKGSSNAEADYELKLAKANEAYAVLEKQKNEVVEKIVTKYVDKIVYVTKWRTNNVTLTQTVPTDCSLNNGWVHVHDASVQGRTADATSASDGTSSGIETNQALGTIVENYGICAENAAKLESLQQYVKDQQKLIEEYNKKNDRSRTKNN
jgi:hypothetical protein